MKQYVTSSDQWVKQAVQKIISERAFAFNDFDTLRDWVSLYISYKSDLSVHGTGEYWQLPSETLDLRTGDCEDFSILLCSLLRAYGVPADQVYVVVGFSEDKTSGHAYLVERWYTGTWRIIEAEQNSINGWAFVDYLTATSFEPVGYFNDQDYVDSLPALPSLPAGVYEFQVSASLVPGSSAQLKGSLKSGQKVTATLERIQEGDTTYAWSVNVYDILDDNVFSWSGSDLKHDFTFTAPLDGTYRIEVTKKDLDLYMRYARLTIDPPDWTLMTDSGTVPAPSPAPAPAPSPAPTPTPAPPPVPDIERLEYTMSAGGALGRTVFYTNILKAGDRVDGFIELTGTDYGADWSYNWNFSFVSPRGETVHAWAGNYVTDNHHEFSFTIPSDGLYKLNVTQNSNYQKELVIEIQPSGWK